MDIQIPSVLSSLSQFTNQNAALVNVTAGGNEFLTVDIGLCIPNQLIIANGFVRIQKGAVLGDTLAQIGKSSGTATVLWFNTPLDPTVSLPLQPAVSAWLMSFSAVGVITVGGTLILNMAGASLGSDSGIVAGDCQMRVVRINR